MGSEAEDSVGQSEEVAGVRTSVLVVVGREEGPFSAPKALEAPMGELGPEPGALLVGVESVYNIKVRRISIHTRTRRTRRGLAKKRAAAAGLLITMVCVAFKCSEQDNITVRRTNYPLANISVGFKNKGFWQHLK